MTDHTADKRPHPEQRLAEQQPETWEAPDPDARETDRAGRLESDTAATEGREHDAFGKDDGIAGGPTSSEEAAVHIVHEGEQLQLR